MKIYKNIDEAGIEVLKDLNDNGIEVSPRGMKCKEIIGYKFAIHSAKNQMVTLKKRKLNYAFQIIEKMSFISGKECPDIICAYNSNMKKFKNERTGFFDGDYAPRIFRQLSWVYKTLKKDPDSRQAVITIRNESDEKPTKDHPCTLSFQFFIRDNKLHMLTNMRSNDAYISCLGYDLMNFMFIQNVLAAWLNIEVGSYHHNVGSMHVYENHYDLFEYLENNPETNNIKNKISNDWDCTILKTAIVCFLFWEAEENIRNNKIYTTTGHKKTDEYLVYLKKYWDRKNKVNK